jgi:hypothetical protein
MVPDISKDSSAKRNSSLVLFDCVTLKMKAVLSYKMVGTTCPVTKLHIPEDLYFKQYHCENLKSHITSKMPVCVFCYYLSMYSPTLYTINWELFCGHGKLIVAQQVFYGAWRFSAALSFLAQCGWIS